MGNFEVSGLARKTMRVVHIITGLDNGGAEAVLYRLVTHDTSNESTVISLMNEGKYGPMLKDHGIQVICIDLPKSRVTLTGLLKLWRTLKNLKPEIVQTWMYHADLIGGLAARLAGVKNVFWNIRHTNLTPGESSRATIFIARICAYLSRFIPQRIICCAQKSVEVHSAFGYNQEKMIVIGNGYQVDLFTPNEPEGLRLIDELNLNNKTVFGMVGRFDILKDHENLLDAFGLLKNNNIDLKILLIGKGLHSDNSQLSHWIQKNNLTDDVLLLGQRSDIPAIMNALDIHVLSSRSEAFPNVLAEAMACGTPCVSTNVGDAALIVGDTGWVIPSRDPRALAGALLEAVNEMRSQPEKWSNRKFECRNRIKDHFSMDKMIDEYHHVWRSVLA